MGVMDLQLGSPAVLLAPPAITLQDLNAELPVIIGLEPQPLRCSSAHAGYHHHDNSTGLYPPGDLLLVR